MRIVVDMQGAQTASQIGHDLVSLVQAIVRNRGGHDVMLAVNDLLANTIEPIRAAFDGLLPQDHIRAFSVIGPLQANDRENERRREVAERLREAFFINQKSDVVLVTSLFEGFAEDAVTSIGVLDKDTPTAVMFPGSLPPAESEAQHAYYASKIAALARARLCLVSEESLDHALNIPSLDRASLISIGAASLDERAKNIISALERLAAVSQIRNDDEIIVEKTSRFTRRRTKILLTKLDHRGDFLLAIPAISRLHARYPGAILDIIVGSWNVAAAERLNLFNKVIPFDYYKANSGETPELKATELSALLNKLDAYDIAIDLRRHYDTRFLIAKVSAFLRIGYQTRNPEIDSVLDIALPADPDVQFSSTPLDGVHMSEQLSRLIDGLPREPNDYVVLPELGPRASRQGLNIAIFPTAGLEAREWPIGNYVELVRLLSANDLVERVNIYFSSQADAAKMVIDQEDKICIHTGLPFSELMQSLSHNVICVANNSFGGHIAGYLGLTVIAIYSGHDTVAQWGPPFGDSYVIHRPVACSPCHLVTRAACQYGVRCLDIPVDFVCSKINEAIRSFSGSAPRTGNETGAVTTKNLKITDKNVTERLIQSVAACYGVHNSRSAGDQSEVIDISAAIARSLRSLSAPRQLLVDVSELARHDARSGIQRVVRSVLKEWLENPPAGYCIEPVYATTDRGYRYARQFTGRFLGQPNALPDEPVEYSAGDIFFGLDHQAHVIAAHREFFTVLRRHGVRVLFLLHDLLAVRLPQYFQPGVPETIANWLGIVAEADGAVCVSRTIADELADWVVRHGPARWRPFKINWSHNGADIENSAPTTGLPGSAIAVLDCVRSNPSFLVVGTVEPRKGHAQALAAFDFLWQRGREVCLIIVGSQGWQVEDLAARLRNHPQLSRRLFWLETISDEYLEELYSASTCLLAASEAEGFGLPLVEAARHKVPVIARDIPIFRELMGTHAFYFSGKEPESIAEVVENWLSLYRKDRHPKSDTLQWLTWKQSAKRLQEIVVGDDCYITIAPTARNTVQ